MSKRFARYAQPADAIVVNGKSLVESAERGAIISQPGDRSARGTDPKAAQALLRSARPEGHAQAVSRSRAQPNNVTPPSTGGDSPQDGAGTGHVAP